MQVDTDILKPAVVLIAWTLLVLVWVVVTRLPAMQRAGISLVKLHGGKGTDADGVLPAKTQWIAHNYNHLVEQPTLFYAIVVILALVGQGHGMNAWIAWGYVAIRILHSLVQALWNRVVVRFTLFGLSTLALVALTLHAAMALWHIDLHH